jgi:hypothetical protein
MSDKIVHSVGNGKISDPDDIHNEIIEFVPKATNSVLYCLLSLVAHNKAYTPPDRCHSTTCLLHKIVTPHSSTNTA